VSSASTVSSSRAPPRMRRRGRDLRRCSRHDRPDRGSFARSVRRLSCVHGRTRHDAIGVPRAEGEPSRLPWRGPGVRTVNGLASYKNEALRRLLDIRSVRRIGDATLRVGAQAGIGVPSSRAAPP
jgi:hypothetical protein